MQSSYEQSPPLASYRKISQLAVFRLSAQAVPSLFGMRSIEELGLQAAREQVAAAQLHDTHIQGTTRRKLSLVYVLPGTWCRLIFARCRRIPGTRY